MTTETPTKKKPRQTDRTLLLAAKLDRIMQEFTESERVWALAWVTTKFGTGAPQCNAPKLGVS